MHFRAMTSLPVVAKTVPICLFLFFATLLSCQRNTAIAVSYIIGDSVPIHAEPVRTAKVIGNPARNTKIEILEKSIEEKANGNNPSFWYRVRFAEATGYISYNEEIIRRNIATFEPYREPMSGLVTASSLRLREAPTLTGKVLTALPNKTIVSVLARGSQPQTIDGKSQVWFQVRAPEGQIGFSFAAYIYQGTAQEIQELKDKGFEKVDGFARITTDNPQFFSSAGGPQLTEKDPADCGEISLNLLPKKDGYVRVDMTKIAAGKTYFHFKWRMDVAACAEVQGWVSSEDAIFVKDVFDDSLLLARQRASEKNLDKDFLRAVNNSAGENLNVLQTQSKELPVLEKEATEVIYRLVEATTGDGSDSPATKKMILARRTGTWVVLGRFDVDETQIRDIDGDSTFEVITEISDRSQSTMTFFALKGGKYVELIKFNLPGQSGPPSEPTAILDPYVLIATTSPRMSPDAKRILLQVKAKKYAKGVLHDFPVAELPEKVKTEFKRQVEQYGVWADLEF